MKNSDPVYNILRKTIDRRLVVTDRGAVAVELAFTLLFLFLFVMFYIALTCIFIGHQRLSFTSFAAARVCAVRNVGGGLATARAIESDFRPHIRNINDHVCEVKLDKTIDIPFDFAKVFHRGLSPYDISSTTTLQLEGSKGGDNDS